MNSGSRYRLRRPEKDLENKVIEYFVRRERYILIGDCALLFNQHLECMEEIFEQLEYRKIIRRLDFGEKSSLGLHFFTDAFVLDKQ